MDIVMIAGLWLPAQVWTDVVTELERLGDRAISVELPGVDDGSSTATLDDQLAAVLAAVDGAERPLVVGHSAAATLAWMVADRRPGAIGGVAMIGGFPGGDGSTYADFFDVVDGVMPFPGWDPFAGPDSDDLDAGAREHFESIAVPVCGGVAEATVTLTDQRRFDVPVTLICPEFGPDDAKAWIEAGDLPELGRANNIEFVDIDSGHWPMLTRADELASILHSIASAAAGER